MNHTRVADKWMLLDGIYFECVMVSNSIYWGLLTFKNGEKGIALYSDVTVPLDIFK